MFQEAIARNLPFCDEFIIATTQEYLHIVENQIQVFHGIKYRCLIEELPRRTAPSTVLACLHMNPSEMVLFVSTNHVIEGGSAYKEAIVSARRNLESGKMACLGVLPTSFSSGHGLLHDNGHGVDCFERVSAQQARGLCRHDNWLWDCGIQAFCAGDFLQEFKKYNADVFEKLEQVSTKLKITGRYIFIPAKAMEDITPLGIGHAVTGRSDKMTLIPCAFLWKRIMTLQTLAEYYGQNAVGRAVLENCENVSVINYSQNSIAVANGIKNAVIVQTDDAVYVTDSENSQHIREIGLAQNDALNHYFQNANQFFFTWGKITNISINPQRAIREISVFPLHTMSVVGRFHEPRQITALTGKTSVSISNEISTLCAGESISIPAEVPYSFSNAETDVLTLLEVVLNPKEDSLPQLTQTGTVQLEADTIVRLDPALKDYLWGGTQLRSRFGKHCDYSTVAESWELSAHPAGQSTVATGKFTGLLLSEYLDAIDSSALGWKGVAFNRFPILIKLIDAQEQLSVQVHPGDEYALRNEDDYGKTELWHIIDCVPDACIYYGFNRDMTREEVEIRAQNGTLLEVINKVPVKPGQDFFIPAGTVHAIGAGILLCEVQQSSNVTYRLYDYNRRDKYGNLRELHLSKALDVLDYKARSMEEVSAQQCDSHAYKYFSIEHHSIEEISTLLCDKSSFSAIVILKGNGEISVEDTTLSYRAADTFFVPAGDRKISISGACEVLHIRL